MYPLRQVLQYLLLVGVISLVDWLPASVGAEPPNRPRPLWTTSRVIGRPEPPSPYTTERRFRKLSLKQPMGFYPEPGTRRIIFAQHLGPSGGPSRVLAFEGDEDADSLDVLFHDERLLYNLAFDPDYEENRYVYLTFRGPHRYESKGNTNVVARYTVRRDPPYDIDPDSKHEIIEWSSIKGGHDGAALGFSPLDGYLYVTTGDGSSEGDPLRHGQNLGTVHGAVLRIDVRNPPEGKTYTVPEDNPFVNTPGARPEIWAYGLRNPWRLDFDPKTGQLWVGQNGQDQWEQVYAIQKGANYGWAIMEGGHPFNLQIPRGPTPISGPTADHPHAEARSISGGVVYWGEALPGLRGSYLYGDWSTGKIWAIRLDGNEVAYHEEIVDTSFRVVGFGRDHDGEVVVLDHLEGGIHKFVPNEAGTASSKFPRTLSATGLFTSVKDHAFHPGLIPFQVNVAQFSNGARAERAIALPNDMTVAMSDTGSLGFKDDAVLIKTLSMPTTSSVGDAWQRIETQMLHRRDGEWEAYTYRWNDEGTDATLVEKSGEQTALQIRDPGNPRGVRQLTWKFSARAECMMCHSRAAAYVLGATGPQLQREVDVNGKTVAQLEHFRTLGIFDELSEDPFKNIPALVDPHDPRHDLDARARSYLHGACLHCHQQDGGGNARFRVQFTHEIEDLRLVNEDATHGTFDVRGGKLFVPGDPDASILVYRLATLGGARMPRLGSTEIDTRAVRLIRDWIGSHPSDVSHTERDRELEVLSQVHEAKNVDGSVRSTLAEMLNSTSSSLALAQAIADGKLADNVAQSTIELAKSHEKSTIRDLFERFLPEEERKERLGVNIDARAILAIKGEPARGQALFDQNTTAQCKNCHQYGDGPARMGPNLSKIGAKLKREELLDSILAPSRKIEPEYRAYLLVTNTGNTYTGTIYRPNNKRLVVRTASEELEFSGDEVLQLEPQEVSLMPVGLASSMSAQELADLLAFLENAK